MLYESILMLLISFKISPRFVTEKRNLKIGKFWYFQIYLCVLQIDEMQL